MVKYNNSCTDTVYPVLLKCRHRNSNAYEDNSPLGVAVSERMGLVKIAKNCGYAIR